MSDPGQDRMVTVDSTFLDRMLAGSTGNLCSHDKANLQRLVTVAGFGANTLLWHNVVGKGSLYTTRSGQYGVMHIQVISGTASEAPYVLNGSHTQVHWTSLRIAEHYTDTAGATDHVFGMCNLLGHRFAPRIKDLKDRKLYAIEKPDTYPVLSPLIGDAPYTAALIRRWAELMRVRASIEAGAVAPSTILRKLAASDTDNALSRALRALGRIERTLFALQCSSTVREQCKSKFQA